VLVTRVIDILHMRVNLLLSLPSFACCMCVVKIECTAVFGSFKPYPDNDDGVQKKYL
jgi:hypothetical protein